MPKCSGRWDSRAIRRQGERFRAMQALPPLTRFRRRKRPPPRRGPREPARPPPARPPSRPCHVASLAKRSRSRRSLRLRRRRRLPPHAASAAAAAPPRFHLRLIRRRRRRGRLLRRGRRRRHRRRRLARRGRRVPDVVQPDFVLQRLLELAAHLLQLARMVGWKARSVLPSCFAISAKPLGPNTRSATTPMTSASGAPTPNKTRRSVVGLEGFRFSVMVGEWVRETRERGGFQTVTFTPHELGKRTADDDRDG